MPEFNCTCKSETGVGRVIFLVRMDNQQRQGPGAQLALYGCLRCHKVYFDQPGAPLTQKHIDRGR